MNNQQIALIVSALLRTNTNPKYYEGIRDAEKYLQWLNEKDIEMYAKIKEYTCQINNTSEATYP